MTLDTPERVTNSAFSGNFSNLFVFKFTTVPERASELVIPNTYSTLDSHWRGNCVIASF